MSGEARGEPGNWPTRGGEGFLFCHRGGVIEQSLGESLGLTQADRTSAGFLNALNKMNSVA